MTLIIFSVLIVILLILVGVTTLRIHIISKPFFNYFKRVLPPISKTEQEALDAGDIWWEAELFRGAPDWRKLHAQKNPQLTVAEQAFIDNQVEALCDMLDDWEIVYHKHDLPEHVWDFLKRERFFGLVIEKKYGGLEFSALAHSTIVARIASRSLSAAINTMVPNSLGPGELLHRYGTEQQKSYYLPRLAIGAEIPCFGLTSLEAGSDAGAMIDTGIICKQGDTLGIKLNFNKRYITLAPVATIIGLAFKLYDPEHLLGEKTELGITVALIPANTSGVSIGKRHFPMNLAFMNGPIEGNDVFVPLDAVIGGKEYIGQGWRMLMECLSIGRSISLPALSTAGASVAYRTTGAYAKLRQQFKLSIGRFEGVGQLLAKIAGINYTLISARRFICGAVDAGIKPAVASAITKYHSTELNRVVLNCALDIHAGRGVQSGPKNYLANPYVAVPVGITVEGANILTRNLIIFGQGATRCHPYILAEMAAVKENNLAKFDRLLLGHLFYTSWNTLKTLGFGLTHGCFIRAPKRGAIAKYYRQLTRMSAALAMTSDIAMLVLGGNLKRKESLSARLGDVLSGLYLSSAVLKNYADNGMPAGEEPLVCWAVEQQLADIQCAFDEFFDNFPTSFFSLCLSKTLKFFIFPYGRSYKKPQDSLNEKLSEQMMKPSELRDRLTKLCYIGDLKNTVESNNPIAVLDHAFILQISVEPLQRKLQQAIKEGKVANVGNALTRIKNAVVVNILSVQEAQQLEEFEIFRQQALAVDEFPAEYFMR